MRRCGTIALVGRPNVGKSTLMNALLREKLSIVSPKAQTTRHRVVGVHTRAATQFVFVDTPGQAQTEGQALNRVLDKTALASMQGVDVVLWLVEAGRLTEADRVVLQRLLAQAPASFGIVVTKVDKLADKAKLLPMLGELGAIEQADFLVPVSSRKRINLDALLDELEARLPEQPWFYEEDTLTPLGGRFLISERIREQLFLRMNKELPYRMTVTVDQVEEDGKSMLVHATIWVDRASQKGIVLGKRGAALKGIGQAARKSLESLYGCPVDLRLWVKVREGWADSERSLQEFGYGATEE